ncbi:kinase-like protein [Gigaspora margarita]|uniref:Kinase-like protein n=1 Tax=Gigaspora margarita TaxID=4874 RepID=A0A8H3ZWN8_GIGMA|nr:kinase-like protein [Gigaspora margarita]
MESFCNFFMLAGYYIFYFIIAKKIDYVISLLSTTGFLILFYVIVLIFRNFCFFSALYGELCARLLFLCPLCSKEKNNSAWCKECGVKFLENNFNNWTSGDQIIDNTIKDIQIKSNLPIDFVEWILYEQLEKGEKIGRGGFGDIYSAFWKQGPISMHGNEFKRTRGVKVALKRLMNNDIEKYKSELCMHINCCTNLNLYTTRTQFSTARSPILRCYGLTKDDEGYMIVMQLAKHAADKAQNIQKMQTTSSEFPHNNNLEFPDNTRPGSPDNTSLKSPDRQNCIENNTTSKSTTGQYRDPDQFDLTIP